MKDQWIFAILIAGLILTTILYPSLGWFVHELLLRDSNRGQAEEDLLRHIQVLEAERATGEGQDRVSQAFGKRASVFSRYPFNFKHEILVSIGRDRGVRVGDIAVAPIAVASTTYQGVLIGKVIEVYEATSLVKTIFDSSFESAVRIGASGTDALLTGGGDPVLTLIPRRAPIQEGDIVYSASQDVPYGIAIGHVAELIPSEDAVFQETKLGLAYDINRITLVEIISGTASQ